MHPLIQLATESINESFSGPPVPLEKYKRYVEKNGAFVTLKIQNHLRGCVGQIVSEIPLYQLIYDMAKKAAFEDSRFPALSESEFQNTEINISVLTEPKPVTDISQIQLGTHGIIFQYNNRSSIFLPEVAIEQGWTLTQTLEQLAIKAGVPITTINKAMYSCFESRKIDVK